MSTTAAPPVLAPDERRRKFLEQQRLESAAYREVLQVPCQAHRAEPGTACWRLSDSSRGVCGPRISRAVGQAHRERTIQLQKEKEQREQQTKIEEGHRRRVRTASRPG